MTNRLILSLTLLIGISSCINDRSAEPNDQITTEVASPLYTQNANAIPGRLAIYVDEELASQLEGLATTRAAATDILTSESLRDAGITSIRRMFRHAGKFEERTRKAGLHRWYNLSFDESAPSTRVANGLLEHPGVLKVQDKIRYKSLDDEPTIVTRPESRANDEEDVFNDPYLYLQWHYKNDAEAEGFVKGMDINVAPLWKSGVTGRPEVVVAIVDGGIDYDHPDLAANMHINEAELNGESGVDDDNNGFVDDIYGFNFIENTAEIIEHTHGTHVAGTVAAVNNNDIGVSGVAGGNGDPASGVRLISCQMLQSNPTTGEDLTGDDTSAAEAIKYGADAGAIISQNSWGYQSADIMDYDTDAIDYFCQYAGIDENGNQVGPMKGGIVLFAAGNDSAIYSNPGQHSSAVSVTAISPNGAMAPYSNYGDWADISAPGGDKDHWIDYVGGVLSTLPVGMYAADYGSLTGTSMACPHVSGVVALYLSKCVEEGTTEGLTREMVIDRLLNTTRTLVESEPDYYTQMGHGLVDASRFVGIATSTTPDTVTDLSVSATTHTTSTLKWSTPNNAKGYTIFYSQNSLDQVDYDALPADVVSIDINKSVGADGYMYSTITNLLPATKYYASIRSWDYADNTSSTSEAIDFTTNENRAPQFFKEDVLVEGSDPVEVEANGQIKLSYTIVDADGDDFEYEFTSGSTAESEPIYNKTTHQFTIYVVGSKADEGNYSATLKVTDEYGAASSLEINYTIETNKAPTLLLQLEDIALKEIGTTKEISLEGVFEDEDGPMSYSVSSSDSDVIAASITESNTILIESAAFGKSTITLSATDTLGATSSCDFTVLCTSADATYSIVLYPNPVTTNLNIETEAISIDKMIFYNNRGVEAKVIKEVGTLRTLDLSSLRAGVYSVDIIIEGKSNIKSITKL